MASSDPRIGFRLPWNSDRSNPREAATGASTPGPKLVPVEDLEPMEAEMDTEVALAREGTMTSNETLARALPGFGFDYEVTSAIPMSDMTPETAPVAEPVATAAEVPATASEVSAPVAALSAPEMPPTSSPVVQPAEPEGPAPQRPRPTKFLADLTRAMQVAAEEARIATVSQHRAEAEAVVGQLRARTTDQESRLRTGADADVDKVREWSQAEMARIERETEERIDARRAQLDDQMARHAELMAGEVDRVNSQVANFENDMDVFFAELRDETDPSVFAARAEQLPEPPAFGPFDEAAIEAIFAEPPAGVPEAPAAAMVAASAAVAAPDADAPAETEAEVVEAEVAAPDGEAVGTEVAQAEADVEAVEEPEAAEAAPDVEAEFAPPESEPDSTSAPLDVAAYEPAADDHDGDVPESYDDSLQGYWTPTVIHPESAELGAVEAEATGTAWATMPSTPDETSDETSTVAGEAAWERPAFETPDFETPAYGTLEPVADKTDAALASELEVASELVEPDRDVPGPDEPEAALPVLPLGEREAAMARIQAAALAAEVATGDLVEPYDAASQFGWSPTFVSDTPEPEPEPAAPEEPAWIFQPRLESRDAMPEAQPESNEAPELTVVAGLDSDSPALEPVTAVQVQTQVVVSGLVSVASIASFKRLLGRLDGVSHVGVSSGPEGEFIFNVQHPETMPLRDLVPTLPGFHARVTGEGAGTLVVAAQDPEG
jgi:hypothetical protein